MFVLDKLLLFVKKNKSMEITATSLNGFNHSKYPWIEWNESSLSGTYLRSRTKKFLKNIKEQLIVELYSK